jgi:protoporphyrinogen oxidase
MRTIILGGGPAGLSAAYHLQDEYLLLEKAERVGGLCKSVEENGFIFDYAGHILFTTETVTAQLG